MWNSEFEQTDVSPNRNVFLLTALIATAALSIRWTIAEGDSLWLDELHTAWAVDGELARVAGRAADGNQNPLFFWMAWACTQCFGDGRFSLRFISVVAGTAVACFAGWLTWRGSKSFTGLLLTGLIISLDWRFVFYATEARPYALMQLLGLLHAGIFASLIGWLPRSESRQSKPSLSDSSKWSLLTLLSIALFYCHITSVWLFVAEAFGFLLMSKHLTARSVIKDAHPKTAFLKPLVLCVGAAAVGCLPGVLGLLRVFGRKANWSDISSPARVLADIKEPLLFWLALPLLIFLSGWVIGKLLPKNETQRPSVLHNNRLTVFVLLWALVPIAGVIAAHYFEIAPLALFRYTVIGTPAMAIFAGLMVGRTLNPVTKIVAIVLIAWSSFQNNQVTRQLVTRQTLPVLRHEDWESPTFQITSSGDNYRPVLLFANVIEDAEAASNLDPRFQDYLRFPAFKLHHSDGFGRQVFPCPTHDSPRLSEQTISVIRGGGWLLIRGSDETVRSITNEIEQCVLDHLPPRSTKMIRIEELGHDGDVVHLFRVDLL